MTTPITTLEVNLDDMQFALLERIARHLKLEPYEVLHKLVEDLFLVELRRMKTAGDYREGEALIWDRVRTVGLDA